MSDGRSGHGQKTGWRKAFARFFTRQPENRKQLLDQLRDLTQQAVIDIDTLGIIEGAVQVADMQVREIMIPRSQMVFIRASSNPKDFLPTIIQSAHSRFPVCSDNPDDVLGILLAKDLLHLALDPQKMDRFSIKDHIRKTQIIPESKRLDSLLKEFRTNRNHMAIVVNEYGGVAGLVTIEDVLEQIVGEIEDEHDIEEDDYLIKELDNNEFTVKALIPIEDFNAFFNSDFSEEEFDTIGGVLMKAFGRLPKRTESVDMNGFRFTVLNADGRTIRLIHVTPVGETSDDTDTLRPADHG